MTAERKKYSQEYYQANKEKWKKTPEQRERRSALRRARYAADKEHRDKVNRQVKESRQRHPLQRRAWTYGLNSEQVEMMLDRGCVVCHANPHSDQTVKLHIDHDHKTGTVRGVLCQACNLAVGWLYDDPIRAMAMYDYLMRVETNGSSGVG